MRWATGANRERKDGRRGPMALMRLRVAAVPRKVHLLRDHPSNAGSVLRQARTAIRFEFASLLGRPVDVPFSRGLRVSAAKRGDSSCRVPYARLPDWPEMAVWRSLLKPGDLFVDVGANVGLYTLLALEAGATAIAVEPAADMQNEIAANVKRNGFRNLELHQVALMDVPGEVRLEGPDPNRRSVVARPAGDIGVAVVASTLDLVVAGRSARGIKIDVEGMEHAVLLGGAGTLSNAALELIQLEWNDASLTARGEDRTAVANLLESAGFHLYQASEEGSFVASPPGSSPPFGRDVFAVRGRGIDHLAAASWERR